MLRLCACQAPLQTRSTRRIVRLGGGAGRCEPPVRRHAGITCAKLWIWLSREEVCMTDAVPEPEGSGEEPEGSGEEPEGSGEEIKRKFREALERKRARHA